MIDRGVRHPVDAGDDVSSAPAVLAAAPRGFGAAAIAKAVRRRLPLFLGVLAAALAVTAIVTLLMTPRYLATAEVVLDASAGRAATATGAGAQTELRIIESREMARAVAKALGDASREETDTLMRGLSVTQDAGSYTIAIGFTAADPQTAADVANEYARQYTAGRLAGTRSEMSPLDRPNARIISRAEPPLGPTSPVWWLNLAIGAGIGLVLALIAALVAERRLSGLTSGSEIEAKLGLHHLGSVPTLKSVLPAAKSPLDAVIDAPMSGFAEAFRGVMMSIRHAGGKGTQVIAITSALPNEGKTTVTACLARSIALGGDAVVLVDCDSRRRDTSALFVTGPRKPGLAEVLRYEATLDEALVRDGPSGAWVLPLTGPPADLSELLGGAAMEMLLEELRRRFKRVLIDTAPVLPISGTRAIGGMADFVVMVVRWRTTPDHAVVAALGLLPPDQVRVGGVVLSQVDMRKQVKFGHGDPSFYYDQYSKYYT